MVVIIAGGDEAGRGPLIGPLTLSLVAVKSTSNFRLSRAGVRDSKLLSRKRREKLYSDIMDIALEVKIDKIEPKEINDAMENNISLNELEAVHFAKLFDSFDANVFISKVYLDSPDVVQNKFGIRFSASSSKNTKVIGIDNKFKKGIKYTKVIAEHKADVKYPTVSAASIIAKVTRDKWMNVCCCTWTERSYNFAGTCRCLRCKCVWVEYSKRIKCCEYNCNDKNCPPICHQVLHCSLGFHHIRFVLL